MGPPERLPGGQLAVPTPFHFSHAGLAIDGRGPRAAGLVACRYQRDLEADRVGGSRRGEGDVYGRLVRDNHGPLTFGATDMGETVLERSVFWQALASQECHLRRRVQARVLGELQH